MTASPDERWLLREKYHGVESAEFLADVVRLAAGEPLAYVIGYIPFLNCRIWLDSRPLIPRPETEYWVNECHKRIPIDSSTPVRILDLCAGSGAIGVATLVALPTCTVDFVEIDPVHLPTVKKNLKVNQVAPERFRILCGDLYTPLEPRATYDYILSNPPYLDKSLDRVDASVVAHEPALALFSDEHGLAHLRQIISGARDHLNEQGELWLEHEPEHREAIHTLGRPYFTVHTHHDQYGLERFSRLVLQ